MPVQFQYPERGWSTGGMRKVGGDPNDAPTTLKLFPYKKRGQQEKEYQKRQDRKDLPPDDPYQMSPKQLKGSGRAEGYRPDFDYAFGQTAAKKGAPTPEQIAYGERAPKKDEGRIEASPSDATMATVMARSAGGPLGMAATLLGKQLAGDMPTGEAPYETALPKGREEAFKQWKQKYAPNDSGEDYDFHGAFLAGVTPDPKTGHWPDTFKKPNHPTFSDQSQYAKDRPDLAGSWSGDEYIPPGGR
jgi:hypothetical protein